MKHTLFFPLAIALSAVGCTGAPVALSPDDPFKFMTIEEVSTRVQSNDPKTFVFDANDKETYAKGHVPKAKWVEYDNVPVTVLPPEKDSALVFYCGNEQCSASHTAAKQAAGFGYSNVYVMPAGIMGWVKSNQPIER